MTNRPVTCNTSSTQHRCCRWCQLQCTYAAVKTCDQTQRQKAAHTKLQQHITTHSTPYQTSGSAATTATTSRAVTVDDRRPRATSDDKQQQQHAASALQMVPTAPMLLSRFVLLAYLKATNSENQPGTRRAAERQPATAGYAVIVRQP